MNRLKIAAAVACAMVALGGAPREAHALASGSVVFDPTNWAENMVQALQSIQANGLSASQLAEQVKLVINTTNQYKQMVDQYKVTLKSMKGMSTSQILGLAKSMGGEVAIYADLADRLGRTDRNIRSVLDIYREIERVGNFTNMTPEQIFFVERQRRQQENSYMRDRFTNIQRTLTNVNQDIQKIDQLRFAIPDTTMDGEQSTRKALENVALHLNLIAGQNTQLLAIMAEESAARSASGVSSRAITEAQEYNRYVKQWQEEWRARQRWNSSTEAARRAWQAIP